jgi:hypothetical protein
LIVNLSNYEALALAFNCLNHYLLLLGVSG